MEILIANFNMHFSECTKGIKFSVIIFVSKAIFFCNPCAHSWFGAIDQAPDPWIYILAILLCWLHKCTVTKGTRFLQCMEHHVIRLFWANSWNIYETCFPSTGFTILLFNSSRFLNINLGIIRIYRLVVLPVDTLLTVINQFKCGVFM